MKKILLCLLLLFQSKLFAAVTSSSCTQWNRFIKPICNSLNKIWTEGHNDMYFSGYAWHNRYTYSPERVKNYNETAWGGGLGRSVFDEKGNFHGVYAIAFLDSHSHVEPALGYGYLKVASLPYYFKLGGGGTLIATSRVDINHNIPIVGILPTVAIFYKRVSVSGTYVPGSKTNGNVLFVIAKLEL